MKKFLAILVCLSLLVGGVFAQTELTPTVTGYATLSWGIDFGGASITHGFNNEASLDIEIPFFTYGGDKLSGGSENKDADVYVDFSGKVGSLTFGSDITSTGTSLNASLHFFGAYIKVYNRPDFSANLASAMKPVLRTPDGWQKMNALTKGFAGYGTKIGYANEDVMGLDVGLKVGSNKTWHDNGYGIDANDPLGEGSSHSMYGLGLDFAMAPVDDYLTIKTTVNAILSDDATTYENTLGSKPYVNFGVSLGSSPIEGLNITVGFDGEYMNDAFGYEVGFDTTYEWATLGLLYNSVDGLNLGVYFDATPGKKELPDPVQNLGVHVGLNMYDLVNFGTGKAVDFAVGLSYLVEISDSMTLTPSATFAMQNLGNNLTMAYEVGVDFSPMEKVTIGLNWHQGGIQRNGYGIKAKGPVSNHLGGHNGTLVLSLTLDY